jgi:hypothetical protein
MYIAMTTATAKTKETATTSDDTIITTTPDTVNDHT